MRRPFTTVITLAALAAMAPALAQTSRANPSTAPNPPDRSIHLVVLGDSLSAGYGLPAGKAFPEQLGRALRARNYTVRVTNAGVSGDTSAGGLARVDWSVPADTDAVIVELGANDALRGIDPAQTRANLAALVARLQARNIAVLIAGMRAPPNMGGTYTQAFDRIYTDLADELAVPLYPFFLDGVAARGDLNLDDGMHPNARGIAVIVENILPHVERLIAATGG